MGDVGIVADGVARGHGGAQAGERDADLRSEDHAGEPGGLPVAQDGQELVEPRLVEALRRDPHLRARMVAMQDFGLLVEQGHQVFGRGVAGIAAGHEDGIDARQLAEDLAPFAQREFDGPGSE